MATLYWGGGTGTWDGFTTTNWYTDFARTVASTRAPSAEDDVVFDSSSNATAYTVTMVDGCVCRDCSFSGPASGNLTITSGPIVGWRVYGSITVASIGVVETSSLRITLYGSGTHTLTTSGLTFGDVLTIQSGTYVLQDALSYAGSTVAVNSFGTLTTNNKTVTCNTIGGSGTFNLGSSTVTLGITNFVTGAVVNGGTSSITLSSATAGIGGGTGFTGGTFYDVTFSSTAITTANIYGNNTFNNLTFAAKTTATVSTVVVYGNQTVSGTLTATGGSSVNRYFFQSNITGTARTLTVATVASLTDVDFRDITVAGASSPWSGTRLGDCGGNSNITFPAAKTVYWNNTAGGAWTTNSWATSSGGTVSTANFPLAQDTAIIDDTGLNSGTTISGFTLYNLKTFTSTKTNAFTLTGTTAHIYGDITFTSAMTVSGFGFRIVGRTTQNLTSAGRTLGAARFNSYNSVLKLQDAATFGAATAFQQGGIDTNNYSLTFSSSVSFDTASIGPLTFTFGSSTVSFSTFGSSSSAVSTITLTSGTYNLTVTGGTFGFTGQTLTWNNVTLSNVSGVSVYGTNTFASLTLASPTATGVSNIAIDGSQTITGTLALAGGTSVTQRRGIVSGTPGTQRTLTAATVTGLTDIDFRDINGAGAGTWTGGTRIGDCGGNAGIGFTAARTVYWNLAGTQNWSATGWATSSGGTPAANNFPLAQDTCVFDNTGAAGTVTLNTGWNVGTINASGRTSAMTLAGSGAINVHGDVTYGSGITSTASGNWIFVKPGVQVFTTAGKSLANGVTVNSPSCTFRHGDAYTSTSSITVTSGTYETQNYAVTASGFTGSGTSTITLGSSTVSITGSILTVGSGTTFSGASSTIVLSSSGTKLFSGGGKSFGTVSVTGGTTTTEFRINNSATITTLSNTAYNLLWFLPGVTLTVTNFNYSGAAGNVVRWYTQTPGQRAYVSLSSYAVGANSVDGGNNSGLTFTGSSPDYFYVKDISSPVTSIDVTVTESGTGADTVVTVFVPSAAVSETSSGADTALSLLRAATSISETSSGADEITAARAFGSDVSETALGADAIDSVLLLGPSVQETSAGNDSVSVEASFAISAAETASGADAVVIIGVANSDVSETASGADVITTAFLFLPDIDEAAAGADEVLVGIAGSLTVDESAFATDVVDTAGNLLLQIDETAVGADALTAGPLWVNIDDLQSADWQIISNPQTPTWTVINTDQGPVWTPINT